MLPTHVVGSVRLGTLVPARAPSAIANLCTALPRSADQCFALFCEVERVPEWLSVVRSVVVLAQDAMARPQRVAFLARLERATIGYTCDYRYNAVHRRVDWATRPGTQIRIGGFAQFAPLGPRACLMTYALELELGDEGTLPPWNDPMFDGHAASASLSDFRDFVLRRL